MAAPAIATAVAFLALAVALVGLIIELSGAYLLTETLQPFVFREFIGRAVSVSWQYIKQRRVVLTPGLKAMLKIRQQFGTDEAAHAFAGLSLIFVGIILQILSVVLLFVVELLRWFCAGSLSH